MTAPIHAPTLHQRMQEALQAARTRTTPASLGRLLQVDRSTMTRRAPYLGTWSALELLTLVAFDPELRHALIEALTDSDQQGESLAVEHDLRQLVRRSGKTIEHLMRRLEDNRITSAEAKASVPDLLELRESIDVAIRDCRAREKAQRGAR